MSKQPTTFTSPSGDRMAVLPLAEYERLVEAAEDAADVRAYDEAKRAIAAGDDEFVPAEIADRILNGENKVKVWRQHRGLTGRELAVKADVSQGYLSQIETGARDGTFDVMKRIAAALEITVDDLA